MKLSGKQKLGALALFAGLAVAVLALYFRSRKQDVPLITAERIGPTFNNDERASQILTSAGAQFAFTEELKAAYRNSGAYRDIPFDTFASYNNYFARNRSTSSPFAGFFGLLGLNTNN
jgi:hypothetical protein